MVHMPSFTRPFRTSSPKTPIVDVFTTSDSLDQEPVVPNVSSLPQSVTKVGEEDVLAPQVDERGTMGSTVEERPSSRQSETNAVTSRRTSTDSRNSSPGRYGISSISKIGKRDRRRSTDIAVPDTSDGDVAAKGSEAIVEHTDDTFTPKPRQRFSSLFTARTTTPISPSWSSSENYATPPESPEPQSGPSRLESSLQDQQTSSSIHSRFESAEDMLEDRGRTPHGLLPRRTSSLGRIAKAAPAQSQDADLPSLPSEKKLPAAPSPMTPPGKTIQRLPFPTMSPPGNSGRIRSNRVVTSPQLASEAGPSNSRAHLPRQASSSSSMSSATVSLPPMPNGIIITPSSPANNPLHADKSPAKRRYHTVGRGASDSAARLCLGEVLDRADSRDSMGQNERGKGGSVPAVLVPDAQRKSMSGGDLEKGDDDDEGMGLSRMNTVRPSRSKMERTSEESHRTKANGSPEPRRRSVRRAREGGLIVPTAGLVSHDISDEQGMVPPPSTTSQMTRYPSSSPLTIASRGRLSPNPFGAQSSPSMRSPSPASSAKSITFADSAFLAADHPVKPRSTSGPLPDQHNRSSKGKAKNKKVSDGSLSDSGNPTGRFASLGIGFAASKKKIKKARSFSDMRRKSDMDTDDEVIEPKPSPRIEGAPIDKEEEEQEMLSATPPSEEPTLQSMLNEHVSDRLAAPNSSAQNIELAQKRKRSGSAGLLRSAAGFFGLMKDKREDKTKNREIKSFGVIGSKPVDTANSILATLSSAELLPPDAPALRRSPGSGSVTPPRSAQPVAIPRPSTPSRAATLASSLTIRRRKRDHSASRSLLTPDHDVGKTPMANPPRVGSLGYFPMMGGSNGSSAAVTPVDEFGGLSTSNSQDSPTSDNTPSRSFQTMPQLGSSETLNHLGPDADQARRRAQSDLTDVHTHGGSMLKKSPADFGQLFDRRSRPKLVSRTESGNSELAFKAKQTIVASSSRRARSGSLLRDATTSTLVASTLSSPQTPNLVVSPTASTVSLVSSFGGRISRQASYEQVVSVASETPVDRFRTPSRRNTLLSSSFGDIGLPSVSEQPPRMSTSSSINSSIDSSARSKKGSLGPMDLLDVKSIHSSGSSGRKRSSTLFSNPPTIAHQAVPFSSPTRTRPQNPRRLSSSLFGNTWSRDSFYPAPQSGQDAGSVTRRSRPTALNVGATERSSSRAPAPAVESDDDAETWLDKVRTAVRRPDILFTLASIGDAIHIGALNLFMRDFDFTVDALDVALRRLLMVVSLPKETQQIDRVMEAFAKRYDQCHPGLLKESDNAYIIAFSLMMLHTDVFNSNNKNKMSKADYVKNTRLDGVPQIVLETFFDNVAFTPFIYVEDEEAPKSATSSTTDGMSSQQSRRTRSDLYDWIRTSSLASLRIDVAPILPEETPLSYIGTRPFFDPWQPKEAFATAPFIEVVKSKPRRKSGATLIANATGPPQLGAVDREDPIVRLKVAKVGLLSRKDDLYEEGKKASNRKWKSWSVMLTGSQLIFIKESTWALSLGDHINQLAVVGALTPGYLLSPRFNNFKPDEVFSLASTVAIHDRMYEKHEFAFRLLMPHGRQYLLQAPDEYEMNEWISLINYASAFKTADIPMMVPLIAHPLLSPSANKRDSVFLGNHDAVASPESPDVFSDDKVTEPVFLDQLSPAVSFDSRRPSSSSMSRWPTQDLQDAHTRLDYISRRVSGFRIKMDSLNKSLNEELRIARNLAVLTPFQRSTREAVEMALLPTAANVRHLRTEICRVSCWAEVLDAETRIAMPAAPVAYSQAKMTPTLTLTREENEGAVEMTDGPAYDGSLASGVYTEDMSSGLAVTLPASSAA